MVVGKFGNLFNTLCVHRMPPHITIKFFEYSFILSSLSLGYGRAGRFETNGEGKIHQQLPAQASEWMNSNPSDLMDKISPAKNEPSFLSFALENQNDERFSIFLKKKAANKRKSKKWLFYPKKNMKKEEKKDESDLNHICEMREMRITDVLWCLYVVWLWIWIEAM